MNWDWFSFGVGVFVVFCIIGFIADLLVKGNRK